MDDPIENVYLNINPIKIMVKTNVGKTENEYQPVTYDMIYSEIKDQAKGINSDYPYFTSSVKIPYDLLFYRDYSYILEFFFSSNKFEKILMKNIVDYVDENSIYGSDTSNEETSRNIAILDANIEYNIQAMLKLLFPIRFTFDGALSSTYRQLVLGEFNPNMFAFDPKNPLSEGETGMMTINGDVYIVNNVVWVNDVINHPIYFDFIVKYNNSIKTKRGFTSKLNVMYREKIMELMILLFMLYFPKTKQPHFFAELNAALENENPSVNGNRYMSNVLANKQQFIKTMIKELDFFVGTYGENGAPTAAPYKMIADANVNGKLNKTIIFEKIYDNERIIAEIVKHITRIYNTYYENNKTDSKVVISSELNANLTKLYNACIAIKATKMVQSFVLGELRFIDMSEKNKDDTTKSKEELDVIGYIGRFYGSFAKMSDNIVKSVDNIIPPTRETSNLLLREEINKIRFKTDDDDSPKLGDVPSCSRNVDFFRDVYNKYALNRGQMPINTSIMYTGINTSNKKYVSDADAKDNKPDGNTQYEIYVVIDLVHKGQFDSGKHRCRLADDNITNELNYLLFVRMENMLNTYRKYDNFNASFSKSDTNTTNDTNTANDEQSKSMSKTQGGKLLVEVLKRKKQHFNRAKTRKSILGTRRVNKHRKLTKRVYSK